MALDRLWSPKERTDDPNDYNYTQACKDWSISDHWPLADAVNLILGLLPRIVQTEIPTSEAAQQQKIIHEIALNCVGDSLLVINTTVPEDQYRVRPREFIIWAEKFLAVPQELKEYLEKAGTDLGKKNVPRERSPQQRHRERCRGIAALLWAGDDTITKAQMAKRPEILEHGCERREYAQKTIEEWIKAENPNRQGGRPRKTA